MKNRLATAKLGWHPRLYNPDLHKWLHRITVPTLIVWGDDDKVIPPAYGLALQQLIPGSRPGDRQEECRSYAADRKGR